MSNSCIVVWNQKTNQYEVRKGRCILFHHVDLNLVRRYVHGAALCVNKDKRLTYYIPPEAKFKDDPTELLMQRAMMNHEFSF